MFGEERRASAGICGVDLPAVRDGGRSERCRVDREHNGVISIQDLHLFFGDDIPVAADRSIHCR